MSHIFKTQSLLTIIAETGYDGLAAATITRINYTKPNNKTGFFPGTVNGTKLTYDLQNGDIDQEGLWKFQAYAEINGLKAFGGIDEHFFEKPL